MTPINELDVGSFFEVKQDHESHLFRLLKKEPVILVAAYWPLFDLSEKPELKSNCTEFPFAENIVVLARDFKLIDTEDLEAISTFERIREAKLQRMEAYHAFVLQAKQFMKQKRWDMAVDVLNEAAPYNKLDAEIYKLRGLSLLHSGNTLLAKADLAFYLEMESDAEIQDILNKL